MIFAGANSFAFNSEVVEYRNFRSSFENMLFVLFGDFGIGNAEKQESSVELAFLIFVFTTFFLSLTMMNIFIAVVS